MEKRIQKPEVLGLKPAPITNGPEFFTKFWPGGFCFIIKNAHPTTSSTLRLYEFVNSKVLCKCNGIMYCISPFSFICPLLRKLQKQGLIIFPSSGSMATVRHMCILECKDLG